MQNLGKQPIEASIIKLADIYHFETFVLEKLGFGVIIIDEDKHNVVYANAKIFGITGYSSEEIIGKNCHYLLCPAEIGKCPISDLNNDIDNSERKLICADGKEIPIIKTVVKVEFKGKKYLIESIVDNSERNKIWNDLKNEISNREQIEAKNEYLAYHDYLTGIYNRRFFEVEFARRRTKNNFPLGIILADIDGLKGCNDTFGHEEGDKIIRNTTHIIKKLIGSQDVFCRVGGDEFIILTSQTSEEKLNGYLHYLEKNFSSFNIGSNTLSISLGYGFQRTSNDSVDTLLKEAEYYMYKRKSYKTSTTRFNTVNVIMQTLFEKSKREKEHSERVGLICEAIAKEMGLDEQAVSRIKIAGILHDIGKIGVNEKILNKKGALTAKEWEVIKSHPEKSARILENTLEYKDLTTVVLAHHERYDGTGYPYGLKGNKIPLEARIVAIADTYDAMTHYRTYRNIVSKEIAVAEIEKCSGKQFDPDIVSVFIQMVLQDNSTWIF